MKSALLLSNISKVFHEIPAHHVPVLSHIDLEIRLGEFFIILGPSGCGKSTLLRIMSGLEKEFQGHKSFGRGISQNDIGFVFQQFALLPWLTVAQNIALGLIAKGLPKAEQQNIVEKELRQFGLEKFAHAYPKELSGGMKQRVGIARALAPNPKIMFLDEPFSELDSYITEELRQELLSVWKARNITIVMVTHVIDEALELADRIAVLSPRPGTIRKIITNNLPRPRNKRSLEFYRYEDEVQELMKP